MDELEGNDLARLDGDGVDAGHVVVVDGALTVQEVLDLLGHPVQFVNLLASF